MKKSVNKQIIITFLSVVIASPLFGAVTTQAAGSPKLGCKSISIGIGQSDQYTAEVPGNSLGYGIYGKRSGARYVFTSANKRIAVIGKQNYPRGIRVGKTSITCTEIYKGKRKKIGTIKVIVKSAEFTPEYSKTHAPYNIRKGPDSYVSVGKRNYYSGDEKVPFLIRFRNPSALYTYQTDSRNLKIRERAITEKEKNKLIENGYGKSYIQAYGKMFTVTAKKAGTYKVVVREKYKGKTKVIGNGYLNVFHPEAGKKMHVIYAGNNVCIGGRLSVSDIVDYSRGDFNVKTVKGKDTVLSDISENLGNNEVYRGYIAIKPGRASVKVSGPKGEDYGTARIEVKENPCTGIKWTKDYFTEEQALGSNRILSVFDAYTLNGKNKQNTSSDDVMITSSDPSIYTVEQKDIGMDEEDMGRTQIQWCGRAINPGTAVLTVQCGAYSDTVSVIVK